MSVETFAADVNFTKSAALKVKELIEEEKNPNLKLRVYITGGGCSGFQYGFTFDENFEEGDAATEIARTTKGVQKVVRVFEYISEEEARRLDGAAESTQ